MGAASCARCRRIDDMEKYELEDSLKEEIRSRTLGEGFIKLVQSVRRGGGRFRI